MQGVMTHAKGSGPRWRLAAFAVCLTASLILPTVPAAAVPVQRNCDKAGSRPEMEACMDRMLKLADDELNRAYQAAMQSIDKADHLTAEQRANWKAALRKAQRQWIAFRDANCGEPVGYEWGGTGLGLATLGCLFAKTTARANELRERYDER